MKSTTLLATTDPLRLSGISRCYSVYGLRLRTSIPLSVPEIPNEPLCDVEVSAGDPSFLEESVGGLQLNSNWAQAHRLPGKWVYARVEGVVECLLSPDGSQVLFQPLAGFSNASFEAYLLGLLMKAILIKKDIHSLHASAVVIEGRAIAFLGFNGFGKSSLAASFVSAGHALLTDDVLRIDEDGARFWAHPGPACLKLLPDSSVHLGGRPEGVPMDPGADKWLFPVVADLQCKERVPLAAVYCMAGPERAREATEISIQPLEARESLSEILYGTQTDNIVEPDRATNPFHAAKRIVEAVPVRRLVYPWNLALLPEVRAAIVADIRSL